MWSAVVSFIMGVVSLFFNRKGAIQKEGEALGEATQQVSDLKSQVKAQSAVANAEANAPSTLAGVEDRLSKGTF